MVMSQEGKSTPPIFTSLFLLFIQTRKIYPVFQTLFKKEPHTIHFVKRVILCITKIFSRVIIVTYVPT